MARKKKFEEGTAEAFRKKKDLSKLTLEDAKAIMKELDKSYTEYKSKWLAAKTKESKNPQREFYKNRKIFLQNHPNTKYRPFLDNITVAITED